MNKKEFAKMPLLVDYSSRKAWEIVCWKEVIKSEELLQLLTTSYDRHNIVMRAVALDGLASGKSYREIGKEFWISPQTLSSIKKATDEKTYRSYLERSKKERKKRKYDGVFEVRRRKPKGTPKRTKYGILYMP